MGDKIEEIQFEVNSNDNLTFEGNASNLDIDLQPPELKPQIKPVIEKSPERDAYLIRAQKQKQYFPKVYDEIFQSMNLNEIETEQLSELVNTCQSRIAVSNGTSMVKTMYNFGINTIESVAPLVDNSIDLSGLSQIVNQDQGVQNILNELSCKYDTFNSYPAEIRLAFSTTILCVNVNNYNKMKKLNGMQNQQVSPETKNKYSNL